ncbi:unnamed protein product [Lactuca saligna]|uniref:Phosducin thioredoxin-like domain-containing protein n=1 Tax=Lactuca saligna TaxID=75948 RepID=A0AA35YXG0_LACSI|nr:unnamed protein product [Lactuca saligna]
MKKGKEDKLKLQTTFNGQERDIKWSSGTTLHELAILPTKRPELLSRDYHFVYKDVEASSTQWDDIQRKLGNLPPKPPAFKPDPFTAAEDEDSKLETKYSIDNKTEEELEDLEDDLDDNRFLEEYRRKRLAEMKQTVKVAKFRSVIPILGSDFVCEVSQAPSDVWANYVGLHTFGKRCTPEGVAMILCQSDHVLNDGLNGEASKEAVLEGVRKRFIEKVVTLHENDDHGSSSD